MRPLSRPSFLPLLPMSVLGIVLLAGCDREAVPTASTAENFGIVPEEAGDASTGLVPPELPPGVEDLPIEERLRTVLVDFPGADDVGICHTQVASQSRPIPFRIHRLEVEIPEEAWDEAKGRSALLQYRRFGGTGRYLTRVARCRIPDSELAVEAMWSRFSLDGGS